MPVTYGGLTAEEWNEISWFLGPSQTVTTTNGIRVPRNHYPMDRWGAVEDRIDSALSSANGILNVILSPVRAFVRDVLHPVINIADKALGFAYDLIADLLQDAINVALDAGSTIIGARDWAIFVGQGLVNDLRTALTGALSATQGFLSGIINGVEAEARTLAGQATDFARRVESDVSQYARDLVTQASSLLSGVVDTVRRDAGNWFADAKNIVAQGLSDLRQWTGTGIAAVQGFAQHAYDDLKQWATTALDALHTGFDAVIHAIRYDILDPLVGKVEDLIGAAGHDFAGIMHVLYDAAEWLVFVTTHIVPEVKSAIEFAESLGQASLDDLARLGAGLGAGRAA